MNIENSINAKAHHHRVGLFGTEEEHLEFERIEKESMQEIINKVLDEVKREVEEKKGILWNDDEQKHRKNIIRYDLILEILELIDQLKLK